MNTLSRRLLHLGSCLISLAILTSLLSLSSFPAAAQTPAYTSTATVLVMDVSGSMGDSWQGGIKITSAQAAAKSIVDMAEQESRVGSRHNLGLVSFSGGATENLTLSQDFAQVRAAIDGLTPISGTNIYDGLQAGLNTMQMAGVNDARYIILLSDGMITSGPSGQEVLSGPVQAAKQRGICIYTVGFGDPGDLDEDLLKRIASDSGCGEYFYANDLAGLRNIYIRIKHISSGSLLAEFNGIVTQSQTVKAGDFTVVPGQTELAISLSWPGSRMELIIHDPTGRVVTPGVPGISIQSYASLVYALIAQPMPGNWWVEVLGAELPSGPEPYNVLVSARAMALPPPVVAPPPGGGVGVALVLLLVGGGGVMLYVYTIVIRRRRGPYSTLARGRQVAPQIGSARLQIVSGPCAGQIVLLNSLPVMIGRGRANTIQIPDLAISRVHARIVFDQGFWTIQDRGSKTGVWINNLPVTTALLKSGDHITIGSTQIVFHSDRH